jgi:peptidoglycan-associated lipoprotein
MNRTLRITALIAAAVLLAGCPKKPATVPEAAAGEPVGSVAGTTSGAGSGEAGKAQPLGGATSGAEADAAVKNRVLFDFDSSEIRPQFAPLIAAHGARLAADKSLRVRLEGNTDERGSAEYNVALGERRAQAVKRALLLQGAADAQLSTVSYGEERPVADGHDEAAWSQNRRVDIVYTGGR